MLRGILSVLGLLVLLTLPASSDEKKTDTPGFEVFARPYFVKNDFKLPSNPAYLLVQDKKSFDKIFGVGFVMGPRPKLVDEKLFDKNLIAVVVKSGNTLWKYEVEKVRSEKQQLIVQYKATGTESPSATYNSSLILSVPRGEYTEIVFVENGKEVGKQEVKK